MDRYLSYQLLSVSQTAEIIGVSKQVVYRLINSGQLKGRKVGERLWRVAEQDLESYLRRMGFLGFCPGEKSITGEGYDE